MSSDREAIAAAYDALEAAEKRVAALSYDALTHPELVGVLARRERFARRQPAVEHPLLARLSAEASPIELGGKSLADVLSTGLRISASEARRRLDDAADLGPRRALSGEKMAPRLPRTADAQSRGDIGTEHARIIRRFFADLPGGVDHATRESAEATLASVASGHRPEGLRRAADRLSALLNPDGALPDDADRARRRYLTLGRQGPDGMSEIRGLLDPEARATLDPILATWGAPGMCNPEDESPCVDGTPSEKAVDGDMRSQPQRNHDALKAMGRAMLASGQLGQHNGLPATIIVSTTLKELESGCGQAVTGGGTLLPMADVIRMAAHAHHYLSVFDRHSEVPLYLGRSKRVASAGQRIVLHAKDRGCTHPGCCAPGYLCEVHHVDEWVAQRGPTNVDNLTFACGPHHRMLRPGGWRTRKGADGRTQWIPPPHLDDGQARVNNYHHPERLLLNDDGVDDEQK